MEDPSEDVFVTLVNTPRGNYRIFEGISEGAGFYLQRVLNVIEKMPKRGSVPANSPVSSLNALTLGGNR